MRCEESVTRDPGTKTHLAVARDALLIYLPANTDRRCGISKSGNSIRQNVFGDFRMDPCLGTGVYFMLYAVVSVFPDAQRCLEFRYESHQAAKYDGMRHSYKIAEMEIPPYSTSLHLYPRTTRATTARGLVWLSSIQSSSLEPLYDFLP